MPVLQMLTNFIFDPATRFMRGLDSKGEWRTPFNPRSSNHRNDDYCEGTAQAFKYRGDDFESIC